MSVFHICSLWHLLCFNQNHFRRNFWRATRINIGTIPDFLVKKLGLVFWFVYYVITAKIYWRVNFVQTKNMWWKYVGIKKPFAWRILLYPRIFGFIEFLLRKPLELLMIGILSDVWMIYFEIKRLLCSRWLIFCLFSSLSPLLCLSL